MDSEAWSAVATTLGVSIVLMGVFVGLYWALRGFMPGSRLYEQELPGPNDLDAKTTKFRMFYTNWCPHCKNAKPKWASLGQAMKNNPMTYGGKTVVLEAVNCELDKGKCARYGVDAYPTFKLETNSKLYEYIGPPEVNTWQTFFKSALGPAQKSA